MEGETAEEALSYAWSRKAADSERIYCNTVWRHSYSVLGSQKISHGSLGEIHFGPEEKLNKSLSLFFLFRDNLSAPYVTRYCLAG